MMPFIQTLLVAVILITLFASVYFSFKYRRQTSRRARGLDAAKMNISMGIMLIAISLVQLLLFTGSSTRVVIGAIFLLLGLFNLFAGIRNHAMFKRMS